MLLAWRVKDKPIPKAQPYNNGHLESFNGSLRDELLDAELFHTLGAAQAKVESWLGWYNGEPARIRVWDTPLLRNGGRPPLRGLRIFMVLRPLRGGCRVAAMFALTQPSHKKCLTFGGISGDSLSSRLTSMGQILCSDYKKNSRLIQIKVFRAATRPSSIFFQQKTENPLTSTRRQSPPGTWGICRLSSGIFGWHSPCDR